MRSSKNIYLNTDFFSLWLNYMEASAEEIVASMRYMHRNTQEEA